MKDERRAQHIHRTMEEIEELRQNNYVMELTYIDTDGKTSYDRVAPICFKERENETRTTFSLPEDFDAERFAQRFFDAEKIMQCTNCISICAPNLYAITAYGSFLYIWVFSVK